MALFLLASLTPAILIAVAALLGGPWPWVALLGGVPCALLLDGTGFSAPKERQAPRLVAAITTGLGLAHLALMPLVVVGLIRLVPAAPGPAAALFLAAGVYFGQVANANAHELIHMSGRWPRRLGAMVYSALLFGHHVSAHRLVHHIHVASDGDPNSARAGESFYAFWLRAWLGSFTAALKAVNAQRARASRRKAIWSHPFLGYGLGAAMAVIVAWALGGWVGVAAWCLVCLYAQMQLLLADYVQHYGLRRAELADGSLEPVSARHSWNAPQAYTAAMMLNAPRHSDHHMNPARSFPELRLDRDTMPAQSAICQNRCMRAPSLILLCLLASPAPADPLDAQAFDQYTRGKTLFYGADGASYGAERYLSGRRVVWTFLDGRCQEGIWYEDEAGQICFLYENNPEPQCWTFTQGAGGLIARFENDPQATELYEAEDVDEEMICYGPDVGV